MTSQSLQILRIDDGAVPVEAIRAAPEKLISGSPEQTIANVFSDATGQFHTGIWSGDIAKMRVAYTENELCVILAGHVRLTAQDGQSWEYKAGDAFVIPAGFQGIWETLEPCRKIYAIFEPQV